MRGNVAVVQDPNNLGKYTQSQLQNPACIFHLDICRFRLFYKILSTLKDTRALNLNLLKILQLIREL